MNPYPSLAQVTNLARSLVNDDMAGATDTIGEGQILVDNPAQTATTLNFLNAALNELARELRNGGSSALIRDNYLFLGVSPINSASGPGNPAPGAQCGLLYEGYFDGLSLNAMFPLPGDMILPLDIWERTSLTSNPGAPVGSQLWHRMEQSEGGLPTGNQGVHNRFWEWREDGIWFPGAIYTSDIRIRYQASLVNYAGTSLNFVDTFIPIMEGAEVLAYKIAAMYAARLGSANSDLMTQKANEQLGLLKNERTRALQRVNYTRRDNDDAGYAY